MNLECKYARLLGEFVGTLKGISTWEIPEELEKILQNKIKGLEEIKL